MQTKLAHVREHTHYPAYRAAVALLTIAGYLAAIGIAAASFLAVAEEFLALVIGGMAAAVVVLLTHLVREGCLMVADAADAIVHSADLPGFSSQTALDANMDWPPPNVDSRRPAP